MFGLVFIVIVMLALAAFDLAADRWGVDSRTMTNDGRPVALFAR
jgi:hypothetical protein